MGTVSLSLPSDGQTIDAADVNTPFNTLAAEFNGNIDNDNIASDAAISGTKLANNSIPSVAYDANARGGWRNGILAVPNTITYNGSGNYSLVFNSTDLTDELSNGMKLKGTRTVTAPTQCTDLESGSSQYYSKTSPAGMTFTDDFVVSGWIKVESYKEAVIASRFNGTSGWDFYMEATGQITLAGFNGGIGNNSKVTSYQSVPLNKWVHVAAQLDMSAFTATTTTSYVMINGADVPATVTRAGTNPTALIQAGDLNIGAYNNATSFFDGKIAQVAIYSAKVTQATITASINQTLAGTETSLISAYSFNNTINDLNTTNANNLTANGSAVATNVDSPFAGGTNASTAYTAGTTEFGEVFNVSFSTNTTVIVQCPDGYGFPTSGGLSAIAYSPEGTPLGWPGTGPLLSLLELRSNATTTATSATQVPGLSSTIYVPSGRKVRISFYAESIFTSGSGSNRITIWDGTVGSGTQLQQLNTTSGTGAIYGVSTSVIVSPAAGSKTYNIGFHNTSAGTETIEAGTTLPAFMSVELV